MSASFVSAAFLTASFTGRNGAGTISVPGVKIGDAILVVSKSGAPSLVSEFYPIVTTDDEVYQSYGGDESASTFTIYLIRSAAT